MLQDKKPAENRESQELLAAPSISPPKGGGAIRGIGEKFAANPVTSTGSVSVPIATSPGRAGFGAQLFLSFDSGAGNGRSAWTAFALPPPSQGKPTKDSRGIGIPRNRTRTNSSFSGAEDLVPVLLEVGDEQSGTKWVREPVDPRTINEATYRARKPHQRGKDHEWIVSRQRLAEWRKPGVRFTLRLVTAIVVAVTLLVILMPAGGQGRPGVL
jgi:Salmonella virulence plasmid 65kDa B protein